MIITRMVIFMIMKVAGKIMEMIIIIIIVIKIITMIIFS